MNTDTEELLINDDDTKIIELSSEEEMLYDGPVEGIEHQKDKPSKHHFSWKKISKKKRTFIVISIILFIILVLLLIYLLMFRKENVQAVILQEDNYRYENGTLVLIDKNKNEIGRYDCQNKSEELCFVAYYTNESELDLEKYEYENNQEYQKRIGFFENNFVFLVDSENKDGIRLYNIKTNSIDGEYDFIKTFDDKSVIVAKDDKYGVIEMDSTNAHTKLDLVYDYLGHYKYNDSLVYKNKSGYGIIKSNGEEIIKEITKPIKAYNDIFYVTNEYQIYDYTNKSFNKDKVDFIELFSDYVVLIKDSQLFIYDNSGVQINLEGYNLSSKNYVKTIILDKDNQPIEIKKAFELEGNNTYIKLTIDDKVIEINPNEARINNSLPYISYSDGHLYFYSNEEKTSLLGKYKCNNQNHISDSDSIYEECFIAKENKLIDRLTNGDLGYLPIYNNRFVFILDQSSVSNDKNILFYDLKQNKALSTYLEVDVGFYNNSNIVNVLEGDNVIAIAKKPNGSYVSFKITKNGVLPIVRNEKNALSIKFLNENILAKDDDNTYHLFKVNGEEITKNIPDLKAEIIQYYSNYVVVKNGDKYQIYNIDSGKVVSDEFDYIALYKEYYVGVANKKINVFNYNSKNKLLCNDIVLDKDGDYNQLFTVKYTSNKLIRVIINTNPSKEFSFNGTNEFTVDGTTVVCGDANEE